MLEMKFIREHADIVKADLNRRGAVDKLAWVDELLQQDQKWRSLQAQANALRQQRNKLTEQIAKLRKEGRDAAPVMREAEAIPDQIRELEQETGNIRERINQT